MRGERPLFVTEVCLAAGSDLADGLKSAAATLRVAFRHLIMSINFGQWIVPLSFWSEMSVVCHLRRELFALGEAGTSNMGQW